MHVGRALLILLAVDILVGLLLGHWVEALLRWDWATLHRELGRR